MEPESDLFSSFRDVLIGKKTLAKNAHLYYRDFFDGKGYAVIQPYQKNTDSQRQLLNTFYESEHEFDLDVDSLKDVCTVFLWDGDMAPYFAASFFVTVLGSRLIGYIMLLKVRHDKQREGLGGAFIKDLREFMSQKQHEQHHSAHIVVGISQTLRPFEFYRKQGFNEILPPFLKSWSIPGCTTSALNVRALNLEEEKIEDTPPAFGALQQNKGAKNKKNSSRAAPVTPALVSSLAVSDVLSDNVDTQSLAGGAKSVISSCTNRTKSGALNKHCLEENCGGKLISGTNFATHARKAHPEVSKTALCFSACTGEDCKLCKGKRFDTKSKRFDTQSKRCHPSKRSYFDTKVRGVTQVRGLVSLTLTPKQEVLPLTPLVRGLTSLTLTPWQEVLLSYFDTSKKRFPYLFPSFNPFSLVPPQKTSSSRHGLHKEIVCSVCLLSKRSTLFEKQSSVCKVCSSQEKKRDLKALTKDSLSALQAEIKKDDSASKFSALSLGKRPHSIMESLHQESLQENDGGADQHQEEEDMPPSKSQSQIGLFLQQQPAADTIMEEAVTENERSLFASPSVVVPSSVSVAPVIVAFTDQQALDQLKAIESSDSHKMILTQRLQSLSEMFTQQLLLNYLTTGEHPLIVELVPTLLSRFSQLSQQQSVGLALVSFVLGGSCWTGTVKMLTAIRDSEQREELLGVFKLHLIQRVGQEMANWVCCNWRVVEEQHLKIMKYLGSPSTTTKVNEKLLSLSLSVVVDDIPSFVEYSTEFFKTDASSLVLACVAQRPKQQKVSFDSFLELTDMLQREENQLLIQSLEEQLKTTPLAEWRQRIEQAKTQSVLFDAESVQVFIDELSATYGEIKCKDLKQDLTQREDNCPLSLLVHSLEKKPNARQLALAQYSVAQLYQRSRQLWVVPSGQGKSRITALAAAIALVVGMFTKVHLSFENDYLLQRDRRDFDDLWLLLAIGEDKVEYHVGCGFKPAVGELVIVDEADTFMLSNPEGFATLVQECCCLCFTATPDSGDVKGAEARVVSALGFQKFHYLLEDDLKASSSAVASLQVDEVITCPSAAEKAAYIKEQSSLGPVLVFCAPDLTEEIRKCGCEPLMVTPHTIDTELLRHLDTPPFKVLVSETQFGMRGIDYRCQKTTMTLVIAQPFENTREAIQGFARVGRFGDTCKRVRFSDKDVTDRVKELQYTARLFQYVQSVLKKPVTVKQVVVKQPAAPSRYTSSKNPARAQKLVPGTSAPQQGLDRFFRQNLQ